MAKKKNKHKNTKQKNNMHNNKKINKKQVKQVVLKPKPQVNSKEKDSETDIKIKSNQVENADKTRLISKDDLKTVMENEKSGVPKDIKRDYSTVIEKNGSVFHTNPDNTHIGELDLGIIEEVEEPKVEKEPLPPQVIIMILIAIAVVLLVLLMFPIK